MVWYLLRPACVPVFLSPSCVGDLGGYPHGVAQLTTQTRILRHVEDAARTNVASLQAVIQNCLGGRGGSRCQLAELLPVCCRDWIWLKLQ